MPVTMVQVGYPQGHVYPLLTSLLVCVAFSFCVNSWTFFLCCIASASKFSFSFFCSSILSTRAWCRHRNREGVSMLGWVSSSSSLTYHQEERGVNHLYYSCKILGQWERDEVMLLAYNIFLHLFQILRYQKVHIYRTNYTRSDSYSTSMWSHLL